MEFYLSATSLLISVICFASAILFGYCIVKREKDWLWWISFFGEIATVAGFTLYANNFIGVIPTPVPAYLGRPIVLLFSLFCLVCAISFAKRSTSR